MPLSKHSATRLIAAENKVKALDLRRRGKSFAAIAKELDVSPRTAWNYIREAMRDLAELGEEKAEELVKLEEERLDALLDAIWDKAMDGDYKATEAALKIMSRRASLRGLDQPTKVQSEQYIYDQLSTEELVSRAKVLGIPVPAELARLSDQRPLAITQLHLQEAAERDPDDSGEG